MPVLKFRKLNRYYHLYRQNNLFNGITSGNINFKRQHYEDKK